MGHTCECHRIDWSGGRGNYKLLSTGEKLKYSGSSGHCCEDKFNEGTISMKTYNEVCQYIPGERGSKFPQHAFNMMIADRINVPVSSLEGINIQDVLSAYGLC